MDSLRARALRSRRLTVTRAVIASVAVLIAVVTGMVAEAAPVAAATVPMTVVAQTRAAICDGVNLRSSASPTAARKGSIGQGTVVTVTGTITGKSWSISCGGRTSSGTTWYVITQINGKTVASLYGAPVLYAATGLFKSATVTVATASMA